MTTRAIAFARRWLFPCVTVAVLLAIQFADPPFRARIRENAFDQLQSLAPAPYDDQLPLGVIAIDDASLAQLGQWPWPRTVLAEVIDRLTDMGARVIALDITMPEVDRTSPEQISARLPATQQALRQQLAKLPAHDEILARSMQRSTVALGFPLEPRPSTAPLPVLKSRFLSFGGDALPWLGAVSGGMGSLPLLEAAAAGNGATSWLPGSDGVLRAVPLLYRLRDDVYPGLGLEALRLFAGLNALQLQVADAEVANRGQVPGIQGVRLGDAAFLPTTDSGGVWLHFRPLASQRYIPAWELLAGTVNADRIKDRIIFVAATAKGLGDTVYSPLGELIPGIEGHVQLVEQLLTGSYLQRPHWENDYVALLLVGTLVLLGLLLSRVRPVWSVLLAVILIAGIFALSVGLFVYSQILLDPFYPALAVTILFIVTVVPSYLRAERDQRWIRDAFARYVSPNRVKFLQAHPETLELGSSYRECSFVMTDLAGFTSLMEQYKENPAMLSDLLNDYIDRMIQIAFRHDGTLDRIVGDAVAVMFSAPAIQPDHAARALACALEMDAFAEAFSQTQKTTRNIPFGRTRIGVNTGTVLIGNFGGKTMLDYRALGDAINTAARLETINGQLGTRICVSGTTTAQCPDFIGRPSGELVLKGKALAVATFEPLTAEEAASPRIADYLAAYALMKAEAPEAKAAFLALAEKYPDDPLAVYHAKRLSAGETGSRVVMKSK